MSNLKILLPFSALITLVYSGGRTLSAQESAQFLNLYRRYCSDSTSTSPSQDGNTFYYCKNPDNGPVTATLTHQKEIQPGETPKQVIFVKQPTYQYSHNLQVLGKPGSPQQTDVYVLPPQADHNIRLEDGRDAAPVPQKPSLYFLKDLQQEKQQSRYSRNVAIPKSLQNTETFEAAYNRPQEKPFGVSFPRVPITIE